MRAGTQPRFLASLGTKKCVGIIRAKRAGRKFSTKNFGDAHRVPICFCLFSDLVFLFLLRCLFLGCHSSILPSIVHGLCNDLLLRLIECIELMKNDVKRKMHHNIARDESHSRLMTKNFSAALAVSRNSAG